MSEVLHTWMPAQFFYKADAPPGKRLRIEGIISTEHRDLQDERVLQDGMDIRPLLTRGWFNDGHKRDAGAELGCVEKAQLVTITDAKGRKVKATRVEGFLLDTPQGRKVWDNARAMQRVQRAYGFSVEGGVLERDPLDSKTIVRSVVREVAITRCPVNPHTKMEPIAKSLEAVMRKAVSVGHVPPGTAGVGAPGAIAATVPQDLDGADRVQWFGDTPFDWQAFNRTWSTRAAVREATGAHTITKSQAVALIQTRRPDATPTQIAALLARAAI